MRLPSQDQRYYYARLANEQSWTVNELETSIEEGAYQWDHERPLAVDPGEDPFAGRPLRARHGQLYTYRLQGSQFDADEYRLEVAFNDTRHQALIGLDNPRPGMAVTSHRDGGEYHFRENRSRRLKLWTYRAIVTRIVDGDTLFATMDAGFKEEIGPMKLRLRGIDTRELRFKAGQRARDYVEAALKEAPIVVVTTSQIDKYGRWLVDLTYLPGESDPHSVLNKGTYLNRELLQQRLAVRYVE